MLTVAPFSKKSFTMYPFPINCQQDLLYWLFLYHRVWVFPFHELSFWFRLVVVNPCLTHLLTIFQLKHAASSSLYTSHIFGEFWFALFSHQKFDDISLCLSLENCLICCHLVSPQNKNMFWDKSIPNKAGFTFIVKNSEKLNYFVFFKKFPLIH